MKKCFALALLLIFLLTMAGCATQSNASLQTPERASFDSPEDAVIAYLEGLRYSDLDRMIGAFALESYVENYNFEALLNRVRVYSPALEIRMPNANALVTAMNIENRRARIVDGIIFQYILLSDPEFNMTAPHVIEDGQAGEFVSRFNESLNAPTLNSIEVLGFIPPEALMELYLSEANQSNIMRQAEVLGADQLISRVAVFEMDGNKYLLLVDAVEYSERWYISQLGGNISVLLGISHMWFGLLPVYLADEGIDIFDGIDLQALMALMIPR